MAIIDVDSHFEPSGFAPGEHPLWELRDELPPFVDVLVETIAGDLVRALPYDQRPDPAALLVRVGATMGMSAQQIEAAAEAKPREPGAAEIPVRLAWMDRVGIDFQVVNPGGAYAGAVAGTHRFLRDADVLHRAIVLCNDYLADNLAGHDDRLSATTILDFDDLDWSIGELERMRAREPGVLRTGEPVRGTFACASRRRPLLACRERPRDGRDAAHRQHARSLRGRLG